MDEREQLQQAFARELSELEDFRISYTGLHREAPLHADDPDVARLIEAMAMFTARTRLAAERGVHGIMHRLFAQHFPHLLTPMPAMTLVRAEIDNHLTDAVVMPRGEAIEIEKQCAKPIVMPRGKAMMLSQMPEDGRVPKRQEGAASYRFLSTRRLRILPIRLTRLHLSRDNEGRTQALLRFEAPCEHFDELEDLDLCIDHGDFTSSLRVFHALKTHLRGGRIVYGPGSSAPDDGEPCNVSFGAPHVSAVEGFAVEHPLQRIRSFFHFPEQELFLSVSVPGRRSGTGFQVFSLILDLGHNWPRGLALHASLFKLHVFPIVNMTHAMADPISYDGVRDRYPIRHPETGQGYRLLHVLGCYKADARRGLVPLLPGALSREGGYQIEYVGEGAKRLGYAHFADPNAFLEPMVISVDALWDQPALKQDSSENLRIGCLDRALKGVTFRAQTVIRPAVDPDLAHRDTLLQVLALKNQPILQSADELKFLLECLGALGSSTFQPVVGSISQVELVREPWRGGANGYRYAYRIVLSDLDEQNLPAVDLLGARLLTALQAWNVEEVSWLELRVVDLGTTLRFETEAGASLSRGGSALHRGAS